MKHLFELTLLALVGLGLVFALGVRAENSVVTIPSDGACICIPDDNGNCTIVCGDEVP